MKKITFARCLAILLLTGCAAWAQPPQQQVRVEPNRESGQSVTAAFEGWFANADGSFSILLGYFNRNTKEELDIPIGPNNKIEPGGPDQGQPTHFLPRRQWGMFAVKVPKDFGNKKVTWTLTANGVTTSIPVGLDPLWEISPFKTTEGNTPPFVGFSESGPFAQGPPGAFTKATATVGVPLPITVFAADDAYMNPALAVFFGRMPAVNLTFAKFRGEGEITFSNPRPPVAAAEYSTPPNVKFHGKASTTATFGAPGEYIIRFNANDSSGEGGLGFQCCWTNGQIRVSVSAAK